MLRWTPIPGTQRSITNHCLRCGQFPGQRCYTVCKPENTKKDKTRYRKPHALGNYKIVYD